MDLIKESFFPEQLHQMKEEDVEESPVKPLDAPISI
jgi:hypothetical protein